MTDRTDLKPARVTTSTGARRLLLVLAVFLLVMVAASLLLNLRAVKERHEQVALVANRTVFQQVVLTRGEVVPAAVAPAGI